MAGDWDEHGLVRFSFYAYRALLLVYPSGFRRDYGGPMLQFFGDCSRRAFRDAGPAGLLALWPRTMLDTLATAIEEHSQRGVEMSKEKFNKLSGWALPAGSLAFFIGWLATSRPEYSPYNGRSLAIDRYLNVADTWLFGLGMLLLSLGFLGLLSRYGRQAGGFGRACLGLGAVFGLASAAGALGLAIDDGWPWYFFFLGTVLQFLALALFGVVCLRRSILPRSNWLPLLDGLGLPLWVLVNQIYRLTSGRDLEPALTIFGVVLAISLLGLAWVGYVFQGDQRGGERLRAA